MKFPAIGLAVVTASVMAGCGPNLTATPTSPTPATTQSPFISRFGGFWDGATAVVRVTGGECVGEEYFSHFGTVDAGTVVISQTQTDVNLVVRSRMTGLSCRYSGTAGPGAFSLSTQRCEGVSETLVRCSNGAARILEQIGSTVTATLSGNTVNGTVATYFNVFADSTLEEERRPVAGMIVEEQFNAIRR